MRQGVKETGRYLFLMSVVYFLLPLLIPLLPLDDLTKNEVFIGLLLFYQPLLLCIFCSHFVYKHGFGWCLPLLLAGLVYPADLLVHPHAEGLLVYVRPYAIITYMWVMDLVGLLGESKK